MTKRKMTYYAERLHAEIVELRAENKELLKTCKIALEQLRGGISLLRKLIAKHEKEG